MEDEESKTDVPHVEADDIETVSRTMTLRTTAAAHPPGETPMTTSSCGNLRSPL